MSDSTNEDGMEILGVKTFRVVGSNVSKINLGLYLIITFPLFLTWYAAQLKLLPILCSKMTRQTFNLDRFIAGQTCCCMVYWAIPGLINLFTWSTDGMEGNIMGMIFALPLLVTSVISVIKWFADVFSSCEENQVERTWIEVPEAHPIATDHTGTSSFVEMSWPVGQSTVTPWLSRRSEGKHRIDRPIGRGNGTWALTQLPILPSTRRHVHQRGGRRTNLAIQPQGRQWGEFSCVRGG